MVRRLVEYQQVHVSAHEYAQTQPALLAAGERAHGLERVLAREAEGAQAVARLLHGAAALVYHRVRGGEVRVAELDYLRQIRHAHGGAAAHVARVGLLLAHYELDQRALAGAVVAYDGDALAARDLELHAGEQRPAGKALAEVVGDEHFVGAKLALFESGGEPFGLLGLLRLAQPLYALFHGERPLVQLVVAHERPEVHLRGGLLQLLYLGLVLFVLLQLLVEAALPLHGVEAVVAGVELRAAVDYLDAALSYGVQEISIVAYCQHRAAEVGDVVLQPLGGAQIQVVRRLVQQKDVRVLEYEPREVDARLFAAGELVELPRAHLGRDVQAVGHAVALPVHVVAAEAAEVVAQAVILVQQRAGRVRGHERLQLTQAVRHGAQPGVRLAQHVLGRPPGGVDGYLRDKPYPAPLVYGDGALVGRVLAGQQPEQRGLAAAVGAQYADVLARVDLKAEVGEHVVADLEGFFQILDVYIYHFATLLSYYGLVSNLYHARSALRSAM